MAKFITAAEAAKLIKDGDSIAVAGMGLSGFPEEVICAIRDSFKETGHPCNLELHQGSAMGDWGVGNAFDGWDLTPRETPLDVKARPAPAWSASGTAPTSAAPSRCAIRPPTTSWRAGACPRASPSPSGARSAPDAPAC